MSGTTAPQPKQAMVALGPVTGPIIGFRSTLSKCITAVHLHWCRRTATVETWWGGAHLARLAPVGPGGVAESGARGTPTTAAATLVIRRRPVEAADHRRPSVAIRPVGPAKGWCRLASDRRDRSGPSVRRLGRVGADGHDPDAEGPGVGRAQDHRPKPVGQLDDHVGADRHADGVGEERAVER